MKDLAIIMPIYNGGKFLSRSLEPILSCDNLNFEVILVNDGSTDDTDRVCKMYLNDERVKYYCIENSGVSAARNYGVKKSNSRWITFLDCDDLLSNDWYNIISKCFNMNFDIIYFTKNDIQIDGTSTLLDNIFKLKTGAFLTAVWSKLYRTDFIKEKNIEFIENVMLGEDMLFNLECILKSGKYTLENASFYMYRVIKGSSTHQFNENIFWSDRLFMETLISFQKKYNIDLSKYISYSKINAQYEFINKLSWLKLRQIKKYLYIFEDSFYKDELESNNNQYFSKFKKFIILLLKKKKIYLAFIILKLKHLIKDHRGEYLIRI